MVLNSATVYLVYNYVLSARHKLEAQWSFANELDQTPVLINGISLSHKNTWPCHPRQWALIIFGHITGACGILVPDQGLNPGAGRSTESLPLDHQGSPSALLLHTLLMEGAEVISCEFQRTPLPKAATCVPGHHCPRVSFLWRPVLGGNSKTVRSTEGGIYLFNQS